MLTLEKCKKSLNQDKRKYTDEEIKQIREYLYFIGKLQIEIEEINNEIKEKML